MVKYLGGRGQQDTGLGANHDGGNAMRCFRGPRDVCGWAEFWLSAWAARSSSRGIYSN